MVTFTRRLRRRAYRDAKTAAHRMQNIMSRSITRTCPIFVLGAQRSGTRLPVEVLSRAWEVIGYLEGANDAFNGMFLKDDTRILSLIHTSPFPFTVFKPICESHRANEFLDTFKDSKIVWIFRDYRDTTNSAVKRFNDHHGNLRELARGKLDAAGWRAGGLTKEKLELVRDLYHPKMSGYDLQGIMWYLRTGLLLELGLHEEPRALLVKYEDLVSSPSKYFSRLFNFVGCPFKEKYVNNVHGRSIGKNAAPRMSDVIVKLCEELSAEIATVYDH